MMLGKICEAIDIRKWVLGIYLSVGTGTYSKVGTESAKIHHMIFTVEHELVCSYKE